MSIMRHLMDEMTDFTILGMPRGKRPQRNLISGPLNFHDLNSYLKEHNNKSLPNSKKIRLSTFIEKKKKHTKINIVKKKCSKRFMKICIQKLFYICNKHMFISGVLATQMHSGSI